MRKIIEFLRTLLFPQVWAAIGAAVVGGVVSYAESSNSGGGSSGSSGSGGTPYYTPGGLGSADAGWQNAYGQEAQIANATNQAAQPGYDQSLRQGQAVNYDPYLQSAQQAGGQYNWLAGQAGQEQQRAMGQQQALYAGGNQVMQTAMDPQSALYNRTQQQLSDQINAGQAQRGLGGSAVGGSEYNQGMSNFNIDWQNQQLARQVQGLGAMGQASGAGGRQGELGMAAGAAMPGYTLQGGQVPMQAQQYAAAQPGQVAQQYQGQMLGQQQMQGNVASAAIPYMNYGQGAQQQNYANNAAQSAQFGQAAQNIGQGLVNNYNTPGSWLNNTFGGAGGTDTSGFQSGGTDYMGGTSTYSPSSSY